jgi:hypothetical protein
MIKGSVTLSCEMPNAMADELMTTVSIALAGQPKLCQQDGTFELQASIRWERLGSCGISLRTKLIDKPRSSWFAKESP